MAATICDRRTSRERRPTLRGVSDRGRACSASLVDKNRMHAWVAYAKDAPSGAGYRESNLRAKLF